MDLQSLLNSSFQCQCGREHSVSLKCYMYEAGAIGRLGAVLDDCVPRVVERVALVADARTWKAAGREVFESLKDRFGVERVIVPDGAGREPVCDRVTAEWLMDQLGRMSPDVVVAVGSGVINDLTKWASFELAVPYMVVATAASMNGYTAANVAPMIDGVKVLVRAAGPLAVVTEPRIIENAPFKMTAAGFGDVIAKFMSHCDWLMNHYILGEYYCRFCGEMVDDIVEGIVAEPEKIRRKDPAAIKALFDSLVFSGVAMTLVGTSAPASGGEHLLSHTLDMASYVQGCEHDLHGRQVGVGVIHSAMLYEKILAVETLDFADWLADIDSTFWKEPIVIDAVRRQYEDKKPAIKVMREKLSQSQRWLQLREVLAEKVPRSQQVRQWLQAAGAAYRLQDIGCSQQRYDQAIAHMSEIRKRPTIVDLAKLCGVVSL